MNNPTKLCTKCRSGMKYGSFVLPLGARLTGFYCLPCGTITERFGTVDVTVVAA